MVRKVIDIGLGVAAFVQLGPQPCREQRVFPQRQGLAGKGQQGDDADEGDYV